MEKNKNNKKTKNLSAKDFSRARAVASRNRIEQIIDVIAVKKLHEGVKRGLVFGFLGGVAVTLLVFWLSR